MNIETVSLPQLSEEVIQFLSEKRYSNKTLEHYQCTYHQLLLYLNERSINSFSQETGLLFINEHYDAKKAASNRTYYTNLVRRINVLFVFYETGTVTTNCIINNQCKLNTLQSIYDFYVKEQQKRDLAYKTIETKKRKIKDFLLFLEIQGLTSLTNLSATDIYKYIDTKKNCRVSTREGILYALRDALNIFADNGLCNDALKSLFPQISTHSESPVPSCFSVEEIQKILLSVDRTSSIGKRDYAVLLLASFLGIRAGDIRDMKISSIKWGTETIEFIQSKTKRFLQIPLPFEVKLALLDYIKNSRPKSDSDYLFLKHCAPYEAFDKNNAFWYILQKYLKDVELNGRKHGLHSLRFSAAGNMLSNGTSITTICNVLGHCYSDTTNHYLKIDIRNLRKAALEVDI